MSIIGDALNRAEEENRSGRSRTEQTSSVPVGFDPPGVGRAVVGQAVVGPRKTKVDPPVVESGLASAKGIAHPRTPKPVKRQEGWPVIGMVLFSLLGLAGYMIVYPDWVDSVWNFQTPQARVAVRHPEGEHRSKQIRETKSAFESTPTPKTQAAPSPRMKISAAPKPPIDTQSIKVRPKARTIGEAKPDSRPARSISSLTISDESGELKFQVDGVMLGGRRTLAVVNGAIVGIGDEVDGATVRAITDNAVALETGGRIRRVPLRAPKPVAEVNKSKGKKGHSAD